MSFPSSSNSDYKIVIGIDFGTSRSGFAYAFTGDKEESIYGKSEWADFKTDSTILIKKNKQGDYRDGAKLEEVVAFGEQATIKYTELLDEEQEDFEENENEQEKEKELENENENENEKEKEKQKEKKEDQGNSIQKNSLYELFSYYKMQLYQNKSTIKSASGNVFSVYDVIVLSLKWLKKQAIAHLKQRTLTLSEDQIKWVLTVPAIWSEKSKSKMVNCAMEAGLIDSPNSKRLALIHEPEAAAIECFFGANKIIKEELFSSGKVLVLDAGSGTIDITVLEINTNTESNEKIKVIIPPKGGNYGSSAIDREFTEFLKEFLQNDNFEQSFEYIDLFSKWVEQKHRVTLDYGQNSKATATINIQENLTGGRKLTELVDEWNKKYQGEPTKFIQKSKILTDGIKIKKQFLLSLFETPINNVLKTLDDLFKKHEEQLNEVKYILMVGSYTNSEVLYHRIKQKFENEPYYLSVRVGLNPGKTIVCGAVRYGLNPMTLYSRTYEYHYGLLWLSPFDEKKHRKDKKIDVGEYTLCKDLFKPLIKKNVPIKVGYISPQSFLIQDQDLTVQIFQTKNDLEDGKAYYIDDDGFEFFGKTKIESIRSIENQTTDFAEITLDFKFGETVINICAINKNTQQIFPALIEYSNIN
ncbi:hsp70 family protein [Anaeramoeba flamelloides]|uniref:Hsp70 family protein n=1 Tax=Anaeramoeba flamelloides TaxID=1746091 RepID=A0ABQ8YYA4_9EUKA|nr:hsp70 family protein [Anaeramoeba flamelloides]